MEIYYYKNKKLNSCPVKDYFKKFINEIKLLGDIQAKVELIAENGLPHPIAEQLKGYSFFEISKPFKKITIRLLCAEIEKNLILIHAFDKPRYYKNKDKKINNKIIKNYNIAQEYYNELKKYEDCKEKYEKYRPNL